MSDYYRECEELWEWRMKEEARIREECPYTGGLDGEETQRTMLLSKEVYRRLGEIQAKYNRA